MPRFVDSETRRREILQAGLEILGENGLPGVTFRSVAARMGGSSTLVTHYYGTRRALIVDLTAYSIELGRQQLAKLENAAEGPAERLRTLLLWLVPLDEAGLREERARVSMMAAGPTEPEIEEFLDGWETEVRDLLGRHLADMVAPGEVAGLVDFLRAVTNGVVLSAVEHPQTWTRKRQESVVATALSVVLARTTPPR
ncbi:TetR/AcrR family transcriptional regulator [Actinoplanes sichuanensis]|uniref:TetR/AcrR family transcriptional regulator n=1 Tax=Actinoplanes sichuanensis TaxID=512349 RepID=A0ABW4AVH7_9ACTN|nr:TetR/AcrR family transcriptional regulator [Actinoplanes sichuanensis]BEL04442.1 TetR/AcrR family transcriptional regulator [Actinoplanes sichuanensis]